MSAVGGADRLALLGLALCFACSRLLYHLAGVRFDATPLLRYMQFADPELLHNRLVETITYLHIQPPLLNLGVGLGLKAFGEGSPVAFAAAFLAFSAAAHLSLYFLLRFLGLRVASSAVLTGLYLASPAVVVYESWLMYTWPTACLLLAGSWALARLARRPTSARSLLLFSLLSAVVLLRSVFHLVWLLAVLGGVVLARRAHWRAVLAGAALPVVVVLACYAKNAVLFDSFGVSSWTWESLTKMTLTALPRGEVDRLVADGTLSPLASLPAFPAPELYRAYVGAPPSSGIGVLDQYRRSTGFPNYNHAIVLKAQELRRHDVLVTLKRSPEVYARRVVEALVIYCLPPTSLTLLRRNADRVPRLERAANLVLYGQLPPGGRALGSKTDPMALVSLVGWFIPLGTIGVVAFASIRVWQARHLRVPARTLVLAFIAGTVAYTVVVANLMEIGENARFGMLTGPLLFAGEVKLLAPLGRAWRRRRLHEAVVRNASARGTEPG